MWSDNDTRVDFIDFQHLVNSVITIISNDDLLPCTIGLYGDWGSGKSSLMQMINAHIEEQEGVLTIKFNGWLFEGYEDAKTVLMGTILDELIKRRTLGPKAKALAAKLLKKIDWMKVTTSGIKAGLGFLALGPIGLTLGGLEGKDVFKTLSEEDYEKYIEKTQEDKENESLRMGIREFHNDFSDLLNETNVKKLVVFIDDLDRCNPNTVIDTLEAIKLFLFVEKSAFIIGADEKLIKYAVKKRFPEIPGEGRFEVGRDYLEKLIQFPIKIPPLSHSEMETYINLLFTNLYVSDKSIFENIRTKALQQKESNLFNTSFNFSNFKETLGEDSTKLNEDVKNIVKEALTLSARITPVLSKGLQGNPRQAKRFLNTLLIRIIMAESKKIELDRRILAKLMLLEYFKPVLFGKLSALQIKGEGKPEEIQRIESHLSKETKSDKKISKDSGNIAAGLGTQEESWIADEEIKEWFQTEPLLSGIDLRPYFYFSRDKLDVLSAVLQRMTPNAQEVFGNIISESKAERKLGIGKLENLNPAESASILEATRDKFLEKEHTTDDESFLNILVDIAEKRQELIPQLFIFLNDVPATKIGLDLLPKLINLTETSPQRNVLLSLLTKLSNDNSNKALAGIASSRLKKLQP